LLRKLSNVGVSIQLMWGIIKQLDFLKKGVPRDSLWSGWFLQEYYYLIH